MSLVSLSHISHNFGGDDIFENIRFTIEKNSKIGLVGKNGSGKSTIFNLISKKIIPSKGVVHIAKNRKIAYLIQEPVLNDKQTLYNCVLESNKTFTELSSKLKKAELELSKEHSEKNLNEFAKLQQEFELIDGYNYETEIKLVLTHLNFPKKLWDQRINKFSGGERTRIQLAKVLLQPYDILLMDEPTNHLDIPMIFWLEKYLTNLNKPYVIISHDRHFLDKTITKIAEIKNKKIKQYSGNFSFYQKEVNLRNKQLLIASKRQQKFIQKTEDFIRRNIAGQKVKQARSRLKKLEKLERIEKPRFEKNVNLDFKNIKRSGNEVYILENLSFGFKNNILAENVNLRINYKDKIAVLGKNGCGKTTFLRLLNEEFQPFSGIAKKGASLQIGYYDQLHLQLDDTLSTMDTIWQLAPSEPQGYVLSYLARYGFTGDDVEKKVGILSGGEKARLYLAKLIHEKPNFLILDEPTNHLDLNMIANLEEALQNYEGTIIFVSHDRYLIKKIATKKWFFNNKTIIETEQNLEELFSPEKPEKRKKTQKKKKKTGKTNPIILKKILSEIKKTQNLLEIKNEELLSFEGEFYDNSIYSDENKVKSLTEKVKIIKKEIKDVEIVLHNLEEKYLKLVK